MELFLLVTMVLSEDHQWTDYSEELLGKRNISKSLWAALSQILSSL